MVAQSPLRLQVKRTMLARKKSLKGHAKAKVLKGPTLRKLRIRA